MSFTDLESIESEGRARPFVERGTIWISHPNKRFRYTFEAKADNIPRVTVEEVEIGV